MFFPVVLCSGSLLLKALQWVPGLGYLCASAIVFMGLWGHTQALQAGSRLQDTSWIVLHVLVAAIKIGTDMNILLLLLEVKIVIKNS